MKMKWNGKHLVRIHNNSKNTEIFSVFFLYVLFNFMGVLTLLTLVSINSVMALNRFEAEFKLLTYKLLQEQICFIFFKPNFIVENYL